MEYNTKYLNGKKVWLPPFCLVVERTPLVLLLLGHSLLGPNLATTIPTTVIMIATIKRKTRICHKRKVNGLLKQVWAFCFLAFKYSSTKFWSLISDFTISLSSEVIVKRLIQWASTNIKFVLVVFPSQTLIYQSNLFVLLRSRPKSCFHADPLDWCHEGD